MPRKKIKITPPEITDEFLQRTWAHYHAWQEECAPQRALYYTPDLKEKLDELFSAVGHMRNVWESLNESHKHLLMTLVMERNHGLRFFCNEPMVYSNEWKTEVLDTDKVHGAFEKNIGAAIADYAEYCRDRKNLFNNAPTIESEKKLTKFLVEYWEKAGGEIINSKELKAWINDVRIRLRDYACAKYKLDKKDLSVNNLSRPFDNMVRNRIEEISAGY